VCLGFLTLVGGLWTTPFARIAEAAASVSANSPQDLHVGYVFEAIPENLMAIATWITGLAIYWTRRRWWRIALGIAHLGEQFGPAHWYYRGLNGLNHLSDSVHSFEVRDLRSRVASIFLPAGILVGLALLVTPNANSFEIGPVRQSDLTLVIMLIAAVASGLVVMTLRDHLRLAIGLSSVGFSLAGVYAFMGAPNVTLVAIVVETMLSMFLIGMMVLMPRTILRFETEAHIDRRSISRDAVIATVSGLLVFFVSWGALSRTSWSTEVIDSQAVLTPAVHGKNIVTVILADFRGFDTMGEITVVAIALIGIISLLRSGRLR
jgi:multicomponent Na+:H+ antiporter subunit A